MASFKAFAFDQVTVVLGPYMIPADAFAPGDDAISIEMTEDLFTLAVGAGGGQVRSKSANRSGLVTLRLQAAHPVNGYLSALQVADDTTGAGVVELAIRSGLSVHAAEKAYIKKSPNRTYGATDGTIEWEIQCAALVQTHGGQP